MRGGKTKGGASGKDDTMVSRKRKAADNDGTKMKRAKAGKDPNKPKRPPSAFFVFMEEFRKEFQENHPDNKKVSVVSKACGDKWKSMPEAFERPDGDVEEEGLINRNRKLIMKLKLRKKKGMPSK